METRKQAGYRPAHLTALRYAKSEGYRLLVSLDAIIRTGPRTSQIARTQDTHDIVVDRGLSEKAVCVNGICSAISDPAGTFSDSDPAAIAI